MPRVSIRISEHLNQELELKAQELDTDKSVIMRDFIRKGLANSQTNKNTHLDIIGLLKRNISYTIMSHCLIEMVVSDYVDNGTQLCEKAHLKSEKLMNHLLQKLSNNIASESMALVKFNAESKTDD